MFRGDTKPRLPNPHKQDIDANLLAQILQQDQITHKEWLE